MKIDYALLSKEVCDKEVVILGICRNVEKDLELEIRNLLSAFSDFSEVHFRIVESDSTDSTLAILEKLAKDIPNFEFVSFGKLQPEIPGRVERIAYCRNKSLAFLESDKRLNNCSYVVVSDLDGVNSLLNREAVLSSWIQEDWDACTANQLGPYYDIYALRHPQWSPDDCWTYEAELLMQGMNPISAREKAVYSRQRRIPVTAPWIRVDSAFGGLAIYKRKFLANVRYSGLDSNGAEICEHVVAHNQFRLNGGSLFINPALINHGWSGHSHPNKFWPRAKRMIRKAIFRIARGMNGLDP